MYRMLRFMVTMIMGALLLMPLSTYASAWPIVKEGQHDANVMTVQHLLTARGFTVSADGAFGPNTASVVRHFQSSRRLTADGIVGPDTWLALIAPLRSGDNSAAVKAAQVQLNKYGYRLSVDGAFGPGTSSATREFQAKHGLAADGIIGPGTWSALTSGGSTPIAPAPPAAVTLTHDQAFHTLTDAGITVRSSGNCSDRGNKNCTSLDQVRRSTIDGIIAFKRASSCAVIITGGTEIGHALGTYSHGNGYKLDIDPNDCVSDYIKKHFTSIALRLDGAPQWKSGAGAIYAYEYPNNSNNHWDILFY